MPHAAGDPVQPTVRAVELLPPEDDLRVQHGADRLWASPHPDLPVLGGVELPAGHHATVAYAAHPGPRGSVPGELAAEVFIVTAHGRWLTGVAGRQRDHDGALVPSWGEASNSQVRLWCRLTTGAVAAVVVSLADAADGTKRPVVADLLVDDPAHDARLFLAIVEGPEHVFAITHLDEQGRVLETTDWRSHDESWHLGRAQIGSFLQPGTPPPR